MSILSWLLGRKEQDTVQPMPVRSAKPNAATKGVRSIRHHRPVKPYFTYGYQPVGWVDDTFVLGHANGDPKQKYTSTEVFGFVLEDLRSADRNVLVEFHDENVGIHIPIAAIEVTLDGLWLWCNTIFTLAYPGSKPRNLGERLLGMVYQHGFIVTDDGFVLDASRFQLAIARIKAGDKAVPVNNHAPVDLVPPPDEDDWMPPASVLAGNGNGKQMSFLTRGGQVRTATMYSSQGVQP